MSMQSRLRTRGILMLLVFAGVLIGIFSPIFPGKVNGLDYLDNLFNMVSKGSSYFVADWMGASEKYDGQMLDVTINMADESQAQETARLLEAAGATAAVSGAELKVSGDMGQIMKNSLADSDLMFHNDSAPLQQKYGYDGRQVLYNWWLAFKAINQDLTAQEQFAAAKTFASITTKVLEPAYNYYGVEAKSWKENISMILLALGFYVLYTVWYGFGLMYLFEGLGLKIGH
ncbi:MAG: hypothetical protein ACK5PS_09140 [Desulfopila sp.]